MVRTLSFHCKGTGSVPGQGTNIPQATWYGLKRLKKKPIKWQPDFLGPVPPERAEGRSRRREYLAGSRLGRSPLLNSGDESDTLNIQTMARLYIKTVL